MSRGWGVPALECDALEDSEPSGADVVEADCAVDRVHAVPHTNLANVRRGGGACVHACMRAITTCVAWRDVDGMAESKSTGKNRNRNGAKTRAGAG